jgi:CRP-like cAMP-binding protein
MQLVLDACKGLPETVLSEGEVFIREGDRTGRLYVLIDGTVSIHKGGVQVAKANTPGSMFGEMSVLLDLPHSASVAALTPVRMHVVADAEAFLASTPGIALHTARVLAQRLHDSTTYLADLKAQYEGAQGQFGMIDRILDSLMNQPRDKVGTQETAGKRDSRL